MVHVYTTNDRIDRSFLHDFATANILPEIKRVGGVGSATIPGNRVYVMRISLGIDRMRAYNVSDDDVMKALSESRMIPSPERLSEVRGMTLQSNKHTILLVVRYNKPEQYANIILKANPEGEILRLKDIGQVELASSFYDIYSDFDGHPSAAIVLKQTPGPAAAVVIEVVKKKLGQIKKESFPPGTNFEVTPLLGVSKDQGVIYAVILTPLGSTLEYTNAKSHELQAIAKGVEGMTLVSSLTGYDALTEGQGSNVATCLIHWKNPSQRKPTSRQIIEKLEGKGRQISNVKLEVFEPRAVPGFGAAGATASAQPPAAGRAEPSEPATKVQRP
jgi:multidrug efflux pump subunit AcrB